LWLYVDKVTISPLKAKKKGKPRTWKVKTKVDGKWETAGELPLDLQSRQLGDKVTKITAMLRATNRPKGPLSTPHQAPKVACRPLAATLEEVHAGRPNELRVVHLFYFTTTEQTKMHTNGQPTSDLNAAPETICEVGKINLKGLQPGT